jgi:transcriptional regulator with XRE-family HTH domain
MKELHPFVEILSQAMKLERLDARQVGERSGLHPATIRCWLRGQTTPNVKDLSKALGPIGLELFIRPSRIEAPK